MSLSISNITVPSGPAMQPKGAERSDCLGFGFGFGMGYCFSALLAWVVVANLPSREGSWCHECGCSWHPRVAARR